MVNYVKYVGNVALKQCNNSWGEGVIIFLINYINQRIGKVTTFWSINGCKGERFLLNEIFCESQK